MSQFASLQGLRLMFLVHLEVAVRSVSVIKAYSVVILVGNNVIN